MRETVGGGEQEGHMNETLTTREEVAPQRSEGGGKTLGAQLPHPRMILINNVLTNWPYFLSLL